MRRSADRRWASHFQDQRLLRHRQHRTNRLGASSAWGRRAVPTGKTGPDSELGDGVAGDRPDRRGRQRSAGSRARRRADRHAGRRLPQDQLAEQPARLAEHWEQPIHRPDHYPLPAARGGTAGRPPQVLHPARKHRTRRSLRWSRWTTASVCSPTPIPVRTACSAPHGVVPGPVTQVAPWTRPAPVQRVQAASRAGQKSPRTSCLDLASVEWPLWIERREAGSRRLRTPAAVFDLREGREQAG